MIWIVTLFVFFVVTNVGQQQEEISDELFQEVLQEVERQNNWEPKL